MKSFFSLVSKYVCDDCKPKPVLKSPKNSSQSVFTCLKSKEQSVVEEVVPSVTSNPFKSSQRQKKSAAQLKAEKLRKNAEKARKQREKRAELKAKAEAAKQAALIK